MNKSNNGLASCGCWIVVTLFNLVVGGWSVNYLLNVFATKMLPFGWATIVGMFVGEFSVPAAVIVVILRHFGIV